MAQEAAIPPGFWGRVQKMIDDSIARFARSGFLRNASITGGAGLSIRDGGALSLVARDGTVLSYIGPVLPDLPDGSPQPGWIVRRAGGAVALALFDAFPAADGTLDQAVNWFDRNGVVVLADDTDSGHGLAKPYVPVPVTRARYTDMPAVTDAGFVDVLSTPGVFHKVNARARVDIRCTTDVSGTTGEVRVLVDDVQVGDTQPVGFVVETKYVGPFVMPGDAYSTHRIRVQARRTAGTGAVRLDAAVWGVQS